MTAKSIITSKSRDDDYTFSLPESESPTYTNLSRYLKEQGWHQANDDEQVHFSETNFQFHTPAAECLEFKHRLAQLVTEDCPQIMPVTYCIDDHNWQAVLQQIENDFYNPKNELAKNLVWILKPALLNNGQHIKIFQNLDQLEKHYRSTDRLGGEHVLQHYLLHPHLLKGPKQGHKYSIRMFMVVTNYAGAFLYPEGYFNIALNPYQADDFTDIRSHITNEHLREDELNVVQTPTRQQPLFQSFYPQIKQILTTLMQGLHKQFPEAFVCHQQRTLAIFGMDFIVDHDERVWLLEANHGPCFPVGDDHPLQLKLYHAFWQALITNFVLPIAKRQDVDSIKYALFETLR
jgi:tubulin--tyrosine ligase